MVGATGHGLCYDSIVPAGRVCGGAGTGVDQAAAATSRLQCAVAAVVCVWVGVCVCVWVCVCVGGEGLTDGPCERMASPERMATASADGG